MNSVTGLLDLFQPGDTVFIPGASAEPRPLVEALHAAAPDLPALDIVHSFVPGINALPLAAPDNQLSETTVFPRPAFEGSESRVRQMPLSYYGYVNYLAECEFSWAIAHLSTPDENGSCSLGVSAEFLPQVTRRCRAVIGLLNRQMPFIKGAPTLHINDLQHTVEVDWPLVTYDAGTPDEVSNQIANNISELIESGSTLQVGLGKVPNQLLASLHAAKKLRFHSGMLSDSFLALNGAGALDNNFEHTTCCALGSTEFYQQLVLLPLLSIRGVDTTHAPSQLLKHDKFVAINSALEIDLFGQANLESVIGRSVSAVGGAADFARAARISKGGKSIVALPATARKGQTSRIRSQLVEGSMISLGRYDVDYVVTEYGIAKLSGKSINERKEALIAIAAPQFRDALANDYH